MRPVHFTAMPAPVLLNDSAQITLDTAQNTALLLTPFFVVFRFNLFLILQTYVVNLSLSNGLVVQQTSVIPPKYF